MFAFDISKDPDSSLTHVYAIAILTDNNSEVNLGPYKEMQKYQVIINNTWNMELYNYFESQ